VPKSRNPKTVEAERQAREELQNPDMMTFDRAMRTLLKVTDGKKRQPRKSAQQNDGH
jgi:hypothetical protein